MAVPFHRTSKTNKKKRRTHFKLTISGLIACAQCGKLIRSHTVCKHCGFYAKKQVLVIEKAKPEPVAAAAPAKKEKKVKKAKVEKKEESK
jgi:large subunit ribosomal protein L32